MNEQNSELVKAIAYTLMIIAYLLAISHDLPKSHVWKKTIGGLHALKTAWEGYRIPAVTHSFRYEVLPIVSMALFLNVVGWGIASQNPSILYLDMTGTAAASFLLGPWWGAIIGILSNLISAKIYPTQADVVLAPWMLVNLTGGVYWGLMARTWTFRQYVKNPPLRVLPRVKTHIWYLFWFGLVGAFVMAVAGTAVSAAVGHDALILAPSTAFGFEVQEILKGIDQRLRSDVAFGGSEILPAVLSALLRWLVTALRYIPDKIVTAAVGLLTAKYLLPLFEQSLLSRTKPRQGTGDNWLTPAMGVVIYTAVFLWSVTSAQPRSWLWYAPFFILFVGCVFEARFGTNSQILLDDRVQRVRSYIAVRSRLVREEFFGAIVVAVLISSVVFMSGLFLIGSVATRGTIALSFLKTILAYVVAFYLLRISAKQWAARMFSEQTSLETPDATPLNADCDVAPTTTPSQTPEPLESNLANAAQATTDGSERGSINTAQQSGDAESELPGVPNETAEAPSNTQRPKYGLALALIGLLVVVGISARYYLVPSKIPIKSIAVLPFTYEADGRDIEYVSDGITEDLISTLTQMQNLTVKPRGTAFRYKGKDVNAKKIGEELNVQAVLTGHIRLHANELRLHVDLIDVQTETNLWSEDYPRQIFNLETLQGDIAKDVAEEMLVRLSGEDRRKLEENGTENGEAYELYLHGRSQWNKRTGPGLKLAVEYYKQAIEKDPEYARAYSSLAETYVLYSLFGVAYPRDSMPQAKEAALKALEINRNDSLAKAKAHAALGAYLSNFAWNQPAAEREFRLAIEINPKYETAHQWLGNMALQVMGRFDESIAVGKHAEELDPFSLIISADTGQNLFFARRYDEAIAQFTHRTLKLEPNFAYARYYLGATYHAKKMYPEAIAEYNKSWELDKNPYVKALLIRSLVKAERHDEAIRELQELEEIKRLNDSKPEAERIYIQNVVFALAYAALNEKEKALRWMEKDVEERSIYPAYYTVDPTYDDFRDDNLRNDPGFSALIRRVASEKLE